MSARGAVRNRMTVFRSSQGELPASSSLCRVLAQWKPSPLKEFIALPVVLLTFADLALLFSVPV